MSDITRANRQFERMLDEAVYRAQFVPRAPCVPRPPQDVRDQVGGVYMEGVRRGLEAAAEVLYTQGDRHSADLLMGTRDAVVKVEGRWLDEDAFTDAHSPLAKAAALLSAPGRTPAALPQEESPWHAFHRAWTACVGTEQYDKAVWVAASAQLSAALPLEESERREVGDA